MASPGDLRDLIALLEGKGSCSHRRRGRPDVEITEITYGAVEGGGPALLFENVKRSRHPLLINQFATVEGQRRRRAHLARRRSRAIL